VSRTKPDGIETLGQERILEPRVGWIAGVEDNTPLVDFEGNPAGPVRARSTVKVSPDALLMAAASSRGAVLLFEDGDPARPLVVGLLEPENETPLLDKILSAATFEVPKMVEVDGDRLVIEGKREVVLRCGTSSMTLTQNGIVLCGDRFEARTTDPHRIKSGKTEIN
jgi:hypothetical protein